MDSVTSKRSLLLAIVLLACLSGSALAQSIGANQGLSASTVAGSPGGSSGNLQTNNGSGGFGAYAGSGPLGAHNFANQISANGAITGAQPAFTDISGSATIAQMPAVQQAAVAANIMANSGGL